MNYWRITKNNPLYRDEAGRFCHEDWTSVHDVGKIFNEQKITFEMYLHYENAYIEAAKMFMKWNGINWFRLQDVEKNDYINFFDLSEMDEFLLYNAVENNLIFSGNNIILLIRLILRELVWCKLINEKMFIHFGYDYYMYIGSEVVMEEEFKLLENQGLFIEKVISPYMQ